MIDLQRLEIKVGDVVKSTETLANGLEPVPFTVKKVKILNLVPVVYGDNNIPIPANTLMIVSKNTEMTLAEKNKSALEEILEFIFPGSGSINFFFSGQ